MIKVTSKRTLNFAKLDWSIEKGEEKELPEGKEAQETILAHWAISEGGKTPSQSKKSEGKKEVEANKDDSFKEGKEGDDKK